jgi:hypothetical protein
MTTSPLIRILRLCGFILATLGGGLLLVWAMGALWFDLPAPTVLRGFAAAALFAGVLVLWFRGRQWKRALAAIPILIVMAWWFTQQPKSHREWQPNVAQTAWVEIHGDEFTFHNVRNCEYRSVTDYTPRWETRTVRLSQLTGLDLAINYWGSPYMSHPIASFQFADAPPLCFSVETRREVGEDYSAIGGFYRRYELIFIVADERDVFRIRTNYNGEDIYLYRLNLTPEKARARFLEYVTTLNALHKHPRWYNAATANCTTSIRAQRVAEKRTPWDWRILINGYADEMMFEHNALSTGGLSFAELKSRALINDRARAANDAPDFSTRIRGHLLQR